MRYSYILSGVVVVLFIIIGATQFSGNSVGVEPSAVASSDSGVANFGSDLALNEVASTEELSNGYNTDQQLGAVVDTTSKDPQSKTEETSNLDQKQSPAQVAGASINTVTNLGGSNSSSGGTTASATVADFYNTSNVTSVAKQKVQSYLNSKLLNPQIQNIHVARNGMATVLITQDFTEAEKVELAEKYNTKGYNSSTGEYYTIPYDTSKLKKNGVYFANPNITSGEPLQLFEPENLSEFFGFGVAVSPSGHEVIIVEHRGAIKVFNTTTGKISLVGNFPYQHESWDNGLIAHTYAYPAYTLDGRHIIFLSEWGNSLIVINAESKDFSKASKFKGYWISIDPSSTDYDLYKFTPDGKSVTFSGKKLDLTQL